MGLKGTDIKYYWHYSGSYMFCSFFVIEPVELQRQVLLGFCCM